MATPTQGERLARIENMLENIAYRHNEMASDIKAIRQDLDQEKARNADLRSKGAGILIGVAIAAGGLGASAAPFLRWIGDLVK